MVERKREEEREVHFAAREKKNDLLPLSQFKQSSTGIASHLWMSLKMVFFKLSDCLGGKHLLVELLLLFLLVPTLN